MLFGSSWLCMRWRWGGFEPPVSHKSANPSFTRLVCHYTGKQHRHFVSRSEAFLSHHSFLGNEKPTPFLVRRYDYLRLGCYSVINISVCVSTYYFQRFYRDRRCPLPCTNKFPYKIETLYTPVFQRTSPPRHPKKRGGLYNNVKK